MDNKPSYRRAFLVWVISLIIITTIHEMRAWATEFRKQDIEIGFVPTMGYLHDGHLSLLERARSENGRVVASIFVNPAQFGPNEDLARYPRDFEGDRLKLESRGVDVLFFPESSQLYGPGYQTYVNVDWVSIPLCGSNRPGHFKGVATVVLKLFNIVTPARAYFGLKDFQQLQVIKTMVRDLDVNVEVIGCPIMRESDGLAMSSRNSYLNSSERNQAIALYESMVLARRMFDSGERSAEAILESIRSRITQEPDAHIDYVSIVDPHTLLEVDKVEEGSLVALAVRIGKTRLIDNMALGL